MKATLFLLIVSAAVVGQCLAGSTYVRGADSQTIPDEDWDYVTVRPKAHMFWWMQGAQADNREEKPLILWLQGGPGASGTGFGNFEEIGPYDTDGKPRPTTWLKAANLLYIDNPVGAGFSYVDDPSAYTTNVQEISADLVLVMKAFLQKQPVFEKVPFYVFCESYGGKMTASFGVALQKAIADKALTMDFRGVALGDSWVSGVDSVMSWTPYLKSFSLIDATEEAQLNAMALEVKKSVEEKKYSQATTQWGNMEEAILRLTDNVNFYNVLEHNAAPDESVKGASGPVGAIERLELNHLAPMSSTSVAALMNGPVRKKIGVIPDSVTWGGQSAAVFQYQSGDFMVDVIGDVSTLVNSGLSVTVYSGQLDLICDTLGTEMWMNKIEWSELDQFKAAKKTPLYPPGSKNTGAFVKRHKNLAFYVIMKAGHMVPADNGAMALQMVEEVTKQGQ